jgi:hypothetical protein
MSIAGQSVMEADESTRTYLKGENIPATFVVRAREVKPGDVIVPRPDRDTGAVRAWRVEDVAVLNPYVRLRGLRGHLVDLLPDVVLSIAAG